MSLIDFKWALIEPNINWGRIICFFYHTASVSLILLVNLFNLRCHKSAMIFLQKVQKKETPQVAVSF